MVNICLFDRIRNLSSQHKVYNKQDYGQRIESIIVHLQKMLNTKHGTTLMDKSYGMPDFTDLAALLPDSIREIERHISQTIEKYEPRLFDVNVSFIVQDEQNLSLCFQIQAMMRTHEKDMEVHLESSIDSGGKAIIKG